MFVYSIWNKYNIFLEDYRGLGEDLIFFFKMEFV